MLEELAKILSAPPDLGEARGMISTAKRIFLIGNGGSAAIASHIANDLVNRRLDATALVDAPTLTCLANDYGYESVYVRQIAACGKRGDVLIAISSSGRSANILRAVEAANILGMRTLTFTGFDVDNTLKSMGHVNVHVPSKDYGVVEVAHLALLHSIL